MSPIIDTDRLQLRHLNLGDVEDIQRNIHAPRIYKMVVPIPPNQPYTATKSWIESQGSGRAANTDYPYAIVQDHKFIGVVGLHRTHIAKPFELGYWISPEAWLK